MNYDLFQAINNLSGHSTLLDNLMIWISNKSLLLLALGLVVIWVLPSLVGKRVALYAGITGLVGLVFNFLITLVYVEPRPFVTHDVHLLIPHVADASFPSDHTTGAFSIALAIALRNKKLGLPFVILALLTGFSRIYVGNHYPGDVLGSIGVSLVASLLVLAVQSKLEPLFKLVLFLYEKVIGVIPALRHQSSK